MLFTDTAPLLPNACFLCGNGSGPFVDLQRDDSDTRDEAAVIQYGGLFHYYLCVTCAMGAAQIVEHASMNTIVNREVLADERRIYSEQATEATRLRGENAELRSALGVIQAFTLPPADVARPEGVDTDTVSASSRPTPRKARTR